MKTKEELNALKEEVEALNKKLAELSEEELVQVTGGSTDESIDDILQRQRDDIRRALEGLLNPPAADSLMTCGAMLMHLPTRIGRINPLCTAKILIRWET